MCSFSCRVACLLLFTLVAAHAEALGPIKDFGGEYFLYIPDDLAADQPVQIVALGHQFSGDGEGTASTAKKLIGLGMTNAVFVGPSYLTVTKKEQYIFADGASSSFLLKIIEEDVRQRVPGTADKIFMYGFSGGAQFSHRFTMKFPDLVAGCAAHSGGSWDAIINSKLKHIPFAVSCGLDDTSGSMGSRIQNAKACFDAMAQAGMFVKARYWPKQEHSMSAGAREISVECYLLATTGLFPHEKAYADQLPSFAEQGLDISSRTDQRKADRWAKNAARKLPKPTQKAGPHAANEPQRETNREQLGTLGLGGKSKDGADYWINDRDENTHGWLDNPQAFTARQKAVYDYLMRPVSMAMKAADK